MDINITKDSGARELVRSEALEVVLRSQGRKLEGNELDNLREVLKNYPDLWTAVGQLGEQVRCSALSVFKDDSLLQESVKFGMEQMRKELRCEHKSPVELLAIEQVITCWLQCQIVGIRMESSTRGNHSMKEGNYWDQRYTQAMNRLNRAMELLSRLNVVQRKQF